MTLTIATETVPLVTDVDGVIRVGRTRVTLDTVIAAFLDGATVEEISHQYPSVDLADVYSAIAYYLRRRAEVDAYLQRRREQTEEIRKQNESRSDPSGIRERLTDRRMQFGGRMGRARALLVSGTSAFCKADAT